MVYLTHAGPAGWWFYMRGTRGYPVKGTYTKAYTEADTTSAFFYVRQKYFYFVNFS